MFKDKSRFRGVWAAKDAVRAAEEHLQSLLPSLARAVGLPTLSYTTIQNQGTHLVEVPVEAERRVPRAWHKGRREDAGGGLRRSDFDAT
ncbi:hypothetical protein GPECTOR_16g662 [Gonium pectorale]|uniref:Uncharacterized protein n=1 Tax=Gonium pectorale TaxID=33097 RepID=A0A150GL24_GONPE|nr:hypothetical protein GPECTOR_16g662 [Gonium pectorale]|eukprot:KXZ50487.1 hypothetical protein GPECTOR_16g662 [Gonium pectorale]